MCNKLKHQWTFWLDKPDLAISDKNWDQFLIKVTTFENIESFWSLFNSILLPSQLQQGINFHFFKSGIEPKWEDPSNVNGGKWMLTISKQYCMLVNNIWEKTLTVIIGGLMDEIGMNNVNGVVLSIRKQIIKIAVWTKDSLNRKIQLKIGKCWKKIIKEEFYNKKIYIEYFPHVNFINKMS